MHSSKFILIRRFERLARLINWGAGGFKAIWANLDPEPHKFFISGGGCVFRQQESFSMQFKDYPSSFLVKQFPDGGDLCGGIQQ